MFLCDFRHGGSSSAIDHRVDGAHPPVYSTLSASINQSAAKMESKQLQVPGSPNLQMVLPFINGGISGIIATTVIQPIDMVKVRQSISPIFLT